MQAITVPGAKGFLLYFKQAQPQIYAELLKRLGSQSLSGLGDLVDTTPATPPSNTWSDTLSKLLTSASQVYIAKNQLDAQNKIIDTQLARAKQGLPPLNINPAQYGITPTVSVGVAPGLQTMLLWGGLGIAGIFLISSFMKHRR